MVLLARSKPGSVFSFDSQMSAKHRRAGIGRQVESAQGNNSSAVTV
jgi:hypothetical protein